jgi:hypothetical protein
MYRSTLLVFLLAPPSVFAAEPPAHRANADLAI